MLTHRNLAAAIGAVQQEEAHQRREFDLHGDPASDRHANQLAAAHVALMRANGYSGSTICQIRRISLGFAA